jgi:RNA polymerase sigma factor (sigma-70 family)
MHTPSREIPCPRARCLTMSSPQPEPTAAGRRPDRGGRGDRLRVVPGGRGEGAARAAAAGTPVSSFGVDPPTLDAFRRRDPAAVRALHGAYGGLVYSVAHRVLGQRELAEEAAQQTFVRAWQAADRIDVARDPAPWLATIAKHVAIDIHRREARRPTRSLADVSEGERERSMASLAPDMETIDAAWQVRRAIDGLPPEESAVVRLQHLEGMTHTEISQRLGIAVGTVKSRSHRAHRRLAGLLGHLREGLHG